jgi:hypothetical protein
VSYTRDTGSPFQNETKQRGAGYQCTTALLRRDFMEWGPQVLALMIPIIAIVMGIGLAMLGLVFDYRRKREMYELHHKERMAAIDKGIEVPPLAADFMQVRKARPTPGDLLRRGLILLFVGLALVVAMSYEQHQLSWWGLLPAAVGLAYLVSYFVERHSPPGADSGSGPARSGPARSGPARSGPARSGPTGSGPTGSGPTGSGPTGSGPTGSGPTDSRPTL